MFQRKQRLLRRLILGFAIVAVAAPAAQAAVDRGVGDTGNESWFIDRSAADAGTSSWYLGQGVLAQYGQSEAISQRQMELMQEPRVIPYLSHGVFSPSDAVTRSKPDVTTVSGYPSWAYATAPAYDNGIHSTYDALVRSHPDVAAALRVAPASALEIERKPDAYRAGDFRTVSVQDGSEIGWREAGLGALAGLFLALIGGGIAVGRRRGPQAARA
jgi:hypothetical protein